MASLSRRQLVLASVGVGVGAAVGVPILARSNRKKPAPDPHADGWKFPKPIRQKVGAFVGGGSETGARAMEAWLKRPLDFVQDYGDAEVVNNVFRFDEWPSYRKIALSQPLSAASGWDLAEAAAGRYDSIYERCVVNLKRVRDRLISVRLGWEMNGDWMPWSANGPGKNQTPANYVAAFRRFARMIHTELPGVPIDWCPNFDKPSEEYYPGDEYVDIIGLDVYLNKEFIPNDWNQVMNLPSGLNWHESFAKKHKRPISYPEWATNYDDGSFITNMHRWMSTRPVVYQAYWNDDASFPGKFDRYPTVGREYLKAWGGR